ncbi:MAG: beta-lactamase family protein [Candidatus Thiodiazotropha sp. (ex Lucina pensylvanica)]|nr:beta-lactamase family protein [Candidatus Thiodiazotropha sp. (ex Lucina pensylvanica)]MBT3051092.1 beta-lactamase family protein [Candidatus Thiodiazotropha sp. (ex Codakia orbicularis)]
MFQQLPTLTKQLTRIVCMTGLTLATLTGCNSSNIQQATPDELFQAVLDEAVARGLPAVSVTIEGRNIDFSGVSGVSDLASGKPLQQDNRFYVASTGKTFVAATLVQMAGDGLLDLDDPINHWLPDEITDRIPSSAEMSVRMLLNHTTGIYDFQNDGEAWDRDFFLVSGPDRHWTQADALPFFLDRPLHFEPGSDYSYSNSNYILAALVIEAVSAQPVRHAIRQRIIDPLGLEHTLQGDEAIGQAGLVHGYFSDEGERYDSHPWYSHYGLADGGIQSNSQDLARFIRGLLKSDRVLNDAMRSEMLQPSLLGTPPSSYGLGINVRAIEQSGETVYSHSGKDPGYQSKMLYVESKDTVITLCASGSFGDYDETVEQLLLEIFSLLEDLQT